MAGAIDLAHRTAFRLGAAEVRPAACEVAGPGGTERLEPRVMKVLVALADAQGGTVTRDDLTLLCWDGRVVGEDSLNRALLKLRRLARELADGSFAIETIKKVGYRLTVEGDVAEPAAAPRRRIPYPALAATLLVVALAGWSTLGDDVSSSPPAPPAQALAPAALDLATRGAAAAFEQTASQQAQAIRYFRAAVEREPESSALWGSLAINYILSVGYTPPERQADVLLRARQAAQRSLALNPGEGHALTAATYLQPAFRNWARRERLHRMAIERMDRGSPAPIIHYGRFLASVGRTRDALAQAEQAMRIHPLVPWLNVTWIELLQANGRLEEAESAAEKAAKLWPRNHDLWLARFFLLAFNGATDAAIAMAEDRKAWPEGVREGDMALLRRAAQAIASGSRAEADAVLGDYRRLAREGQAYAEQAIRVAAALDRPDAALSFAEALYGEGAPAVSKRFADHDEYAWANERATAPLFLHASRPLWGDPRFLPLAGRIGLVAYWRQSRPPDLCSDPAARDACRRHGIGGAVATLQGG